MILAQPDEVKRKGHPLFLLLAVFAAVLLLARYVSGVFVHRAMIARVAQQVNVDAPAVIGVRTGEADAFAKGKFTLVEFMDYQCPPCRQVAKGLPSLLKRYAGRVSLVVRNMPISFHKNARPAAIAAEAAREQGKFWEVHDALLTEPDLAAPHIASVIARVGLDQTKFERACESTAKTTVEQDERTAKTVGVDSTPTSLIYCPDGRLFHLHNINQVGMFVP